MLKIIYIICFILSLIFFIIAAIQIKKNNGIAIIKDLRIQSKSKTNKVNFQKVGSAASYYSNTKKSRDKKAVWKEESDIENPYSDDLSISETVVEKEPQEIDKEVRSVNAFNTGSGDSFLENNSCGQNYGTQPLKQNDKDSSPQKKGTAPLVQERDGTQPLKIKGTDILKEK